MRTVYKISALTSERVKYTYNIKQYVLVSFGKMVFAYCESHMQDINTLHVTEWSFLLLHKEVNCLEMGFEWLRVNILMRVEKTMKKFTGKNWRQKVGH
jgi:hypothetical protein